MKVTSRIGYASGGTTLSDLEPILNDIAEDIKKVREGIEEVLDILVAKTDLDADDKAAVMAILGDRLHIGADE